MMEMMDMIRRLPAFAMPPFNYFAWLAEALERSQAAAVKVEVGHVTCLGIHLFCFQAHLPFVWLL